MPSLEEFTEHRPRLFALAYRMLGTVTDAEDVLQEAYLRWSRAEGTPIESPRAYLTSIVSRLCIDHLRASRTRREQYVGPWLPEPVVEDPAADETLGESLSTAFLILLESLTPIERAVFLLHDVFGYRFEEIAEFVGKTPVSCRQIASRARKFVTARRPRFSASRDEHDAVSAAFLGACRSGDLDGLMRLLSPEVVAQSDGGGKVVAALRPILGARNVARFFVGIFRKAPPELRLVPADLNGRPGWIALLDGRPYSTISFDLHAGRVQAVYLMRNPEKLVHVAARVGAAGE